VKCGGLAYVWVEGVGGRLLPDCGFTVGGVYEALGREALRVSLGVGGV